MKLQWNQHNKFSTPWNAKVKKKKESRERRN